MTMNVFTNAVGRFAVFMAVLLTVLFMAGTGPLCHAQDIETIQNLYRPTITQLLFRDGSNNTQYVCYAETQQARKSFTISASQITSVVDSANTSTVNMTGHGFKVNNQIIITGATVDTDLNGTYIIQTVPGANSFTITTASVTDATYTEGTITITSSAPRSVDPIWTIKKQVYTTTYKDLVQWSKPGQICDNKAVSTGATQIEYR